MVFGKYSDIKVDTFCNLMYTDTERTIREKGQFHVSAEILRLDETLGFCITGSDCSALELCDCVLGAAWNKQSICGTGVSADRSGAALYGSDYPVFYGVPAGRGLPRLLERTGKVQSKCGIDYTGNHMVFVLH